MKTPPTDWTEIDHRLTAAYAKMGSGLDDKVFVKLDAGKEYQWRTWRDLTRLHFWQNINGIPESTIEFYHGDCEPNHCLRGYYKCPPVK